MATRRRLNGRRYIAYVDSTAADLRWFDDGVKTCCLIAGSAKIKGFVTAVEAIIFIESRVGAVALYTVLWTVVVKYRKWPFSAPRRTKPLNRSIQKFEQLITSAGPPNRPKFIMIGRGSRLPI
jgi:hypothetical protein